MQQEWLGSIRLIRPEAGLGHALGDNESSACYAALDEVRHQKCHLVVDLQNTPSINGIGLDELSATDHALQLTNRRLILINTGHLSEALRQLLPERFTVCRGLPAALTRMTEYAPG